MASLAGDLAAVLFDLDGTLVDTEKVWGIALAELTARYGGVLTDPVRAEMIGASSAATMSLLLDHVGQPWRDPVEGADWLDARVLELFTDGVVWRPGAPELLDAVRVAGIPTGLVTNTNRPLVEVALHTLGRFKVIVCGDDVERPKPDPQPYTLAARRLGVDPHDCVVIEDSPAGIRSARSAGCAVIAVPNEVPLFDVDGQLVASLLEVDLSTLREAARRNG
jgi:HAD superfamily hydrolase (TIGR01509 family)